MKRAIATAVLILTAWAGSSAAQASKNYRTRLAPVPITTAQVSTVGGSGQVTAVLSGNRLTITGAFEGLKSPATFAKVHRAKPGTRGNPVFDLTVTKTGDGTTGTISGTLTLTPQQLQDLDQRWLYVQLHSEKAPDGNLWGWLFPQETKK
jgi:hypothetical protein